MPGKYNCFVKDSTEGRALEQSEGSEESMRRRSVIKTRVRSHKGPSQMGK